MSKSQFVVSVVCDGMILFVSAERGASGRLMLANDLADARRYTNKGAASLAARQVGGQVDPIGDAELTVSLETVRADTYTPRLSDRLRSVVNASNTYDGTSIMDELLHSNCCNLGLCTCLPDEIVNEYPITYGFAFCDNTFMICGLPAFAA